ncbi:homocysteine S-methyltransferase family protein [Dehalobacterium formicoaceticum]|uniref:Homocysteine S-methyltransferase family protein n=1 Tax=Dehalobacterium formicoaceticum TaxID=51515 RepID=A0ABT1Y1Z4_9FIRM|nr:homocysteine S-methyltransferase family protein [Dehalobacterium formicoaceticum]MCR6544893.1 homocysteine S-methyltransferase family protein [Dehalobacterium formicoaceticum]
MDFLSFIKTKQPVIFDGGMGTQLARYGLELSGGVNNLIHPETVLKVHQDYVSSGADVITANTFTMNPIYLKTHNVQVDMAEVNQAGVQLAKRSGARFILGDMGPTGQLMVPFGPYTEEEIITGYQAQGRVLAEAGVDGFIIETMMDLKEALCALKACKEVSRLPVVVSFTLSSKDSGGRTMMGQTLAECAAAVEQAGGDVIGTNCGDLDPEEIADIIAELREKTTLPILAMPNAGKPKLVKGETIYDMTPEVFAQGVLKCFQEGASLVGGCCGTTPEHIKALTELFATR